MNKKTNVWSAIVETASASETVQRTAFTFGYRWNGSTGQIVCNTIAPVLLFNPDDRTIMYGLTKNIAEDKSCEICFTYDHVLQMLKNPPKVKKVEEVGCVKVHEDGSLLVAETYVLINKDVEQIVEVRNKLMGKKQKLPVVRFRYHSPTSGSKARHVALVSEDDVYMSGLDLDDGNKFKQFRKDRLEIGGSVWFCGLKEV